MADARSVVIVESSDSLGLAVVAGLFSSPSSLKDGPSVMVVSMLEVDVICEKISGKC